MPGYRTRMKAVRAPTSSGEGAPRRRRKEPAVDQARGVVVPSAKPSRQAPSHGDNSRPAVERTTTERPCKIRPMMNKCAPTNALFRTIESTRQSLAVESAPSCSSTEQRRSNDLNNTAQTTRKSAFECSLCRKTASCHSDLHWHIIYKHPEAPPDGACCSACSSSLSALRRDHICTICGEFASCLIRHDQLHQVDSLGENFAYQCQACGRLFEELALMKAHFAQSHSHAINNNNNKTKSSSSNGSSRRRRSSSKVKCPYCARTFSVTVVHERHIVNCHFESLPAETRRAWRHAEKAAELLRESLLNNECVVCGKVLQTLSYLRAHVIKWHPRFKLSDKFPTMSDESCTASVSSSNISNDNNSRNNNNINNVSSSSSFANSSFDYSPVKVERSDPNAIDVKPELILTNGVHPSASNSLLISTDSISAAITSSPPPKSSRRLTSSSSSPTKSTKLPFSCATHKLRFADLYELKEHLLSAHNTATTT